MALLWGRVTTIFKITQIMVDIMAEELAKKQKASNAKLII